MSEKEPTAALRIELKGFKARQASKPKSHWDDPKAMEQEARYAPKPQAD